MSKSRANLDDVAKQANVSKSTVSRVLNNKVGGGFTVKNEVRERIIAVAKSLNYRPNLIAQSLTAHRTHMICILGGSHALSDIGNIYQTVVNHITRIIDSELQDFDVTVDVSQHMEDVSELPGWRIDGAVVLARSTSATIQELESIGIPYVVVNGPADRNGYAVVPDDVGGTRLAMKHLIELGHTRIAYAGPRATRLEGHSSIMDRYGTYLDEINKLSLPLIKGPGELFLSAEEFLQDAVLQHKATAVLAYGHMEGLRLMQAARKLGISVPEDLSLICFCEEYAHSVISPGLTFVDLRSEAMGCAAADLLKNLLEGERCDKVIKIDEKLVTSESTAPPKK